jgi:hypothetical protein
MRAACSRGKELSAAWRLQPSLTRPVGVFEGAVGEGDGGLMRAVTRQTAIGAATAVTTAINTPLASLSFLYIIFTSSMNVPAHKNKTKCRHRRATPSHPHLS